MSASAQRSGSFRSLLVVAALVMAAALAVAGGRSYRDLEEIRRREARLVESLETSRVRTEGMREEMERVRTDPATLERLAREELGLVLPGDVVILLPEAPEPADAAD